MAVASPGSWNGQQAKPIIAAVEGYALAGGFEVALSCDLIVSSEDASFGLPEVTRGLVAAAGGLLRLARGSLTTWLWKWHLPDNGCLPPGCTRPG